MNIIEAIYSFSFSLFGITISSSDLSGTIWNMLDLNTIFSSKFTLYSYVSTINSAIVPIGLSLLALFTILNFIKMSQDIERIGWEKIVFKAIVFFALVFLVRNSMSFFTSIARIVQNDVLMPVRNALGGDASYNSFDIAQELIAAAESQGGISKYFYYAFEIILAIPYIATIIMILSQVFVRAIKLLIYIMFSPLPIALAAEGEVYRGKAISFFMSFAGVCFEAVVIFIGSFIYTVGYQNLSSSISTEGEGTFGFVIAILFLNGVFSAIISLSSQLSDRFFGRG